MKYIVIPFAEVPNCAPFRFRGKNMIRSSRNDLWASFNNNTDFCELRPKDIVAMRFSVFEQYFH